MKPKLQKSPSAKKILGNVGGRELEGYIMIYFCMCKRAGQIFNTLRFSGEQLQVFQSRKRGVTCKERCSASVGFFQHGSGLWKMMVLYLLCEENNKSVKRDCHAHAWGMVILVSFFSFGLVISVWLRWGWAIGVGWGQKNHHLQCCVQHTLTRVLLSPEGRSSLGLWLGSFNMTSNALQWLS